MAKPRTNDAACAYWAEGITSREPQPSLEVNSIIVRGDVVFSFGSHFPMGVILRREDGRVRRVLVNADRWNRSGGFADTNGDLGNVLSYARMACTEAGVPLHQVHLTEYSGQPRVRPRDGDPEPPVPHLEVPTYFYASDPGPEPVDDGVGCLLGRTEAYEYQSDNYITSNLDLYADDQIYAGVVTDPLLGSPRSLVAGTWLYRESGGSIYSKRMHLGRIVWGARSQEWEAKWRDKLELESGDTYKQCPHCAAFAKVHEAWYVRMHGRRYGRGHGRGYKLYAAMIEEHGDEQGWREARREDWRRVRDGRKALAEWSFRNHIPLAAVPLTRVSGHLIRTGYDFDGYPYRKDEAAYFREHRKAERAKRRREREREERVRLDRQVERFARGIRARRRQNFIEVAADVTNELVRIREAIDARTTDESS
jgi:hypothetical protein